MTRDDDGEDVKYLASGCVERWQERLNCRGFVARCERCYCLCTISIHLLEYF
jgi:hypothetical protein